MLKAIYQEEDWIAEVEIAQDNSNNLIEKYELKVIKTIQESRIYKATPDGEMFKVWQDKKSGFKTFTLNVL